MKKHIRIKHSYDVWRPSAIRGLIYAYASLKGFTPKSYAPYIIEWWLHNIFYYLTKPFVSVPKLKRINERCKHVDLMIESEDK